MSLVVQKKLASFSFYGVRLWVPVPSICMFSTGSSVEWTVVTCPECLPVHRPVTFEVDPRNNDQDSTSGC